jgi:hypothetical protein
VLEFRVKLIRVTVERERRARLRGLAAAVISAASVAFAASEGRIIDGASAIDAAKRYLKARCTVETPCRFKPEHEGKQWRVWVQLTKRSSANGRPVAYPGGTLILYFGEDGSLKRRLEGE